MSARFSTYLLFGGAGLVGMAVARRLAVVDSPDRVVVCGLTAAEAEGAVATLREEHPQVEWVPDHGNLFVPTEFAELGRGELLADDARRAAMLRFSFGPFAEAAAHNHMAVLIRRHRPDAIVDCVNTATGISYQDTWESTALLREELSRWSDGAEGPSEGFGRDLEVGLLAQATPQIIRHVRILFAACSDVGTKTYLKVGTTGTGGMGLNIPYTHSEDKPSKVLLAKNAVAFAHTGLLFLAARVLSSRPAARRRLASRFEHLLVDEVQDTDPLQAEVVARRPARNGKSDERTAERKAGSG